MIALLTKQRNTGENYSESSNLLENNTRVEGSLKDSSVNVSSTVQFIVVKNTLSLLYTESFICLYNLSNIYTIFQAPEVESKDPHETSGAHENVQVAVSI